MVVSLQSPVKKQVFYLALVWRQLVEVQFLSKTNEDGEKKKKVETERQFLPGSASTGAWRNG